jgi:LPS sulfotransferase NodH
VQLTRAIILTSQRSGSTLLVSSLQSHPEILCRGEILIAGIGTPFPRMLETNRHAAKLVRFALSGAWHPTRLMGRFYDVPGPRAHVFKAMYNHLAPPWTRDWLVRQKDIRVIHLQRRNLLKQYVSYLLMGRRREKKGWLPNTTEPVAAIRIRVSPDKAIRYFRRMQDTYPRFADLFREHDVLPLVYEDMVDAEQITTATALELCDFLQVSRRPLTTPYIKINPESLRDIVINYDELSAALRPTEYAAYLADAFSSPAP